jgi:hypothetical protein
MKILIIKFSRQVSRGCGKHDPEYQAISKGLVELQARCYVEPYHILYELLDYGPFDCGLQ